EAAEELGLRLPDDFHDALVGSSEEASYQKLVQVTGMALPFDDWVRLRYGRYLKGLDAVTPHQMSLDLWHSLDDLQVLQATVSNSDRMLVEANLQILGLSVPRAISVTRNDVRNGKPDPEPYLRAAHLLGVEPAECAVIEDSATGRQAGLAAGMQVFVMPWYDGMTPETPRIESLIEMAAA
ncbi:MAG: HAD family phosphatase, partial [Pseudomonadota bacterium]